jgi:hypothetical protein
MAPRLTRQVRYLHRRVKLPSLLWRVSHPMPGLCWLESEFGHACDLIDQQDDTVRIPGLTPKPLLVVPGAEEVGIVNVVWSGSREFSQTHACMFRPLMFSLDKWKGNCSGLPPLHHRLATCFVLPWCVSCYRLQWLSDDGLVSL